VHVHKRRCPDPHGQAAGERLAQRLARREPDVQAGEALHCGHARVPAAPQRRGHGGPRVRAGSAAHPRREAHPGIAGLADSR